MAAQPPVWADPEAIVPGAFGLLATAAVALIVTPHLIHTARQRAHAVRRGIAAAVDWWQHRRHPLPVAATGGPTYLDLRVWLRRAPRWGLTRADDRYRRMKDRGALHGEHLVRARAVRAELEARAEADQLDAVAELLCPADRNWITRHMSNRKTQT